MQPSVPNKSSPRSFSVVRHVQLIHSVNMAETAANDRAYHFVNGVLVPSFVLQDVVDRLKTVEYFPDDVWIVSYPKTGTMWTAQIVRLIHNKGIQDDTKLTVAVPWPEASSNDYSVDHLSLNTMPRPRALRSHLPHTAFPCGLIPSKFIYVMRNPKDMAVSLFSFLNLYKELEWEQFWKLFTDGSLPFGDYFDHLLSWWEHKDDINILFIKYEDMKKDLPQAISKIAAFLEVDLSFETVNKIAELTSFDKMKTDKTANYSWVERFNNDKGEPSFLRKGMVGNWKEYFSAEQSDQLDRKCAEKLTDTGIVFDYD